MSDERRHSTRATRDADRGVVATALLGSDPRPARRRRLAAVALGLALVTVSAYELGLFTNGGGVVFIPFYAALVGLAAACWAGYARQGLLAGWVLTVATLFGWQAEWATDISARPLVERIAYVLDPAGLASLAVLGAILAVVGVSVGAAARWSVETLRAGRRARADG
jgi:hypothetical protein